MIKNDSAVKGVMDTRRPSFLNGVQSCSDLSWNPGQCLTPIVTVPGRLSQENHLISDVRMQLWTSKRILLSVLVQAGPVVPCCIESETEGWQVQGLPGYNANWKLSEPYLKVRPRDGEIA